MNLILVRHGQTDWNVKDLLQGCTNVDLNEVGILQAKETAKNLQNIKIDFIYASPLNRTLDTANYINQTRNLQINKDNRLLERNFGNYEGIEGLKFNFKKYWDFNVNLSDNNVESIKDFFARTHSFLREIYTIYGSSDKNILVVTHNGVNIAISSILNGIKENFMDYNLNPSEYKIFENLNLVSLEDLYGKYKI